MCFTVLIQINEMPKPEFMYKTLDELRIGTFSKVHTVRESTTIFEALKLFVEHRVSALPVIESSGVLFEGRAFVLEL